MSETRDHAHLGSKRLQHSPRRAPTANGIGSLVHPREVFADAIADRAANIIVAHNHPSGTLTPSQADIDVTHRLKETGELIDIKLIDHILVTKGAYQSIKIK